MRAAAIDRRREIGRGRPKRGANPPIMRFGPDFGRKTADFEKKKKRSRRRGRRGAGADRAASIGGEKSAGAGLERPEIDEAGVRNRNLAVTP